LFVCATILCVVHGVDMEDDVVIPLTESGHDPLQQRADYFLSLRGEAYGDYRNTVSALKQTAFRLRHEVQRLQAKRSAVQEEKDALKQAGETIRTAAQDEARKKLQAEENVAELQRRLRTAKQNMQQQVAALQEKVDTEIKARARSSRGMTQRWWTNNNLSQEKSKC